MKHKTVRTNGLLKKIFTCGNGKTLILQDSSSVEPAIWLGTGINNALLINAETAQILINELEYFIETGMLEYEGNKQ